MRLSITLVSALAVATHAAPVWPDMDLENHINPGDSMEDLSNYFNVLATRVQLAQAMREPPVCDVSQAQMPIAPEALPPATGLYVKHVAVGRGTQNYTCEASNAETAPAAAGAVATLFNASCVAALYPDLLERIPGMSMQFDLGPDGNHLGPSPLKPSGIHYFTNGTTPFFNLDSEEGQYGQVELAKNSSTAAPSTAAAGQGGEAAVTWLKLDAIAGGTGDIQVVYRVDTAGGTPPATCEGMPETFEVQYAAVYWFWAGEAEEEE